MTINIIEWTTVTEQKFIDLETRIAFLEDTVDDLNKLVYQQSRAISQYQEQMKSLTQHMKQVQSDIQEFKPQDEVPPHYWRNSVVASLGFA